jgi:hypothetical protein
MSGVVLTNCGLRCVRARGKAVGDSGERHTGCGDLRIAKALALHAHGQAEDGAISG